MELHGSLNMIGYGLAAIGSAIGVGMIAMLGFALAEALAILGLVFAFVVGA